MVPFFLRFRIYYTAYYEDDNVYQKLGVMEMVMEINGKEVQFTIQYDGWGDQTDFNTGEHIEVLLSLRCIIDDEEVLEAYTKYDQDAEAIYTLVKIGDEIATFKGDRLDHVDVYTMSRLIGNPVKSQLSIETLNWCLDVL